MKTSSWSGCQLIYSDSSSLSSTLRLVWCFGFAAMTTSPTLSQFFIGCVYHNGSILRLRSWRSECCMVWLRHTWISWFVLLTCLWSSHLQPTFINVTSAWHPCIPAGIHRPSVVSGRRINSVEHSAIWDSVVTFADSVSSTTGDVSISEIIPWCPTLMTTSPWSSQ